MSGRRRRSCCSQNWVCLSEFRILCHVQEGERQRVGGGAAWGERGGWDEVWKVSESLAMTELDIRLDNIRIG